jgi:tetratricopeptide (TPR) repeat protein
MIAPLIAALLVSGAQAKPASPPPRILVVPFESPRDGRTYWLGEAAALVMTDDLNARGLGAITRAARERAYDQLHLPPHVALSRATVIKVGELVGAVEIIVGDVRVEGDTLIVHAQPIRIDVGRGDAEVTERGSLRDLFAIVQKVARRVAPGGPEPAAVPTPSLQVFEPYVKGLLAEQPATQASFLDTALKADPAYHRARLALWDVRNAQGDHAAALAAAKAVPETAAEARAARFRAALSLIGLKQFDEAYTTLRQLQDAAPDPAVLNNLGIVQLHRTPTPETGKPTYFFTKAAEGDADNPAVLFNAGYAYALDKDPQGAIYWLREALRRDPADADAHVVLASALEAAGNGVEAAREREIAGRLSSEYADGTARRDPLPRGLERLLPDLDAANRTDGVSQAIATTAQRDQQDVAQFHLERARRLFQAEQDRDAMTELRRAVFLSPYESEAHLLIGQIHLRGGRPREAADALKISLWSKDTVAAHIALGEAYLRLKDTAAARAEAQKALALDSGSVEAKTLLDRIGR